MGIAILADKKRVFNCLGNERGAALILSLVLIVVMSLLGAMALNNSNSEFRLTTNYRATQSAFYAADRAVEYASSSSVVDNNDLNKSGGSVDLTTYQEVIKAGTVFELKAGAPNRIFFVRKGPPPEKIGNDAGLEMRYYRVDVTGKGPRNASSRIETMFAKY